MMKWTGRYGTIEGGRSSRTRCIQEADKPGSEMQTGAVVIGQQLGIDRGHFEDGGALFFPEETTASKPAIRTEGSE